MFGKLFFLECPNFLSYYMRVKGNLIFNVCYFVPATDTVISVTALLMLSISARKKNMFDSPFADRIFFN